MQAGAFGSFNDKTIVRYSDEVHTVRTDPFYTEFKYEVRTGPSAEDRSMESGAFGINDGGYHKWAATQAADKTDTGPSYAEWRKQMESVRKDTECFFGRFKSRFRMFKTPLTFHDKGDIDNAFFTCVALQNMLLEWDKTQGFFTTWEVDASWGHFDDEDGTTVACSGVAPSSSGPRGPAVGLSCPRPRKISVPSGPWALRTIRRFCKAA